MGRTGTRPCLCKQCDLRKGHVLGGLNTKGPGPGGVAFRSVPRGTPARAALLSDLGVSVLWLGSQICLDRALRVIRAVLCNARVQLLQILRDVLMAEAGREVVEMQQQKKNPSLCLFPGTRVYTRTTFPARTVCIIL